MAGAVVSTYQVTQRRPEGDYTSHPMGDEAEAITCATRLSKRHAAPAMVWTLGECVATVTAGQVARHPFPPSNRNATRDP